MTEEPETFTQFLGQRKVYTIDHEHLDGSDLPIVGKPTWTVAHQNADGSPSQGIGILETSPDGCTARFTAEQRGAVTITVSAVVGPTAVATKVFQVNVKAHPPVTARGQQASTADEKSPHPKRWATPSYLSNSIQLSIALCAAFQRLGGANVSFSIALANSEIATQAAC
jgi:hypothetical protein